MLIVQSRKYVKKLDEKRNEWFTTIAEALIVYFPLPVPVYAPLWSTVAFLMNEALRFVW